MNELLENLDRVHTTEMGLARIARNLSLDVEDVVGWCKERIEQPQTVVLRKGKNWYVHVDGYELTINAYSYTIITAHKEKRVCYE